MANLDAALMGLPLLSIFFFYLAKRSEEPYKSFRDAWLSLGFFSFMVFTQQAISLTTTSTEALQALNTGAMWLWILYMSIRLIMLVHDTLAGLLKKERR